ncbi:MAG: SRPBCC domain-containing protein [Micromonosporaceae bacterium]|nr:SRPBCC domain-containing protein [Micromonosporaceae bacterium]
MGHRFEQRSEFTVNATPEQVWEAIATGPGIDSWFMGRNQVEPGPDGSVRTAFGGYAPVATVTAWEPPRRLAYGTGEAEDGRSIAYEFLVDRGERGGATVRMVVSGFLPGDDWQAELAAMTQGGDLFARTLRTYLTHFPGRTATPVTAFGPPVPDWDTAWAALRRALGLAAPVAEGDRARFAPAGLPPVDGVVYAVNPQTIGIRTGDALYRFLQGFQGSLVAGHQLFSGTDPEPAERAWRNWLAQLPADS